MKNSVCILLAIFFIFITDLILGENEFGYVSTASFNIGDDVQSFAAKQFLPDNALAIDREFIGSFEHSSKIPAIINGWFMHTKDFYWYRKDAPPPAKSWPPSDHIDPLLISIHLAEGFLPFAFSDEAIRYLKTYGPVGARDLNTLKELQKRNIPSYFSGCLSLTLNNDCYYRNDIIYAVDLDEECVKFIQSKTHHRVERITHIISEEMMHDTVKRHAYLQEILEKYKRAKCVVTVRLHATMPCLAFETPVLLINERNDRRFHGLRDLTRNCSRDELLNGQIYFDFDNPGENPRDYLVLRKKLIDTVQDWVKRNAESGS